MNRKHHTCTRPDCNRQHYARGLCRKHYDTLWYQARNEKRRIQRLRKPPPLEGENEEFEDVCTAHPNCKRLAIWYTDKGPVCDRHFQKMRQAA